MFLFKMDGGQKASSASVSASVLKFPDILYDQNNMSVYVHTHACL